MLVFSLLLEPVSLAAALSDDKGGYESQAAAKLQQSNELQSKIDNVSDEKRALDEAADAAIKEHEARKAELDATDARLAPDWRDDTGARHGQRGALGQWRDDLAGVRQRDE